MGSEPDADFRSVKAALDAAPEIGATIAIAPGSYRERLTIAKPSITLKGSGTDAAATVIVYDESAGSSGGTFDSATVSVTGRDFSAENLTIANDFNRTHVQQPKGSQALALMVSGDRAVFRHVRLLGNQDTLYAGSSDCTPPGHQPRKCSPTRQYFDRCTIAGNVDFIFGNSIAFFEGCEIHSTEHKIGYITAQGKQSEDEDSVFVFDHCTLSADPGVEHVWLGRPWRPRASVVFLNSEMGGHIEPAGFREWHPEETEYMYSAFYAEYNSSGPGARPSERDPRVKALSTPEAKRYERARVLAGADHWDPGVAP